MTWREQARRHRRGEPSGGSPSRRTDRTRRPAEKVRPTEPADQTETETEPEEYDEAPPRRPTRRPVRRSTASRVVGQALGRLTTRRAALLALVVCALALSIAVPLHTYLSQRDALRAQLVQQEALRQQQTQLQQREQQLSDPAQVEAEARTRLHYVMPGETPYVVQLPGSVSVPGQPTNHQSGPTTSWYQALWNSIVGQPG